MTKRDQVDPSGSKQEIPERNQAAPSGSKREQEKPSEIKHLCDAIQTDGYGGMKVDISRAFKECYPNGWGTAV